ncbi:c-type cytochrome [Longitalea luteola]|uniref:c-type cytochrome n=1 Tax=Longitalea luteola TaxID=2812563 RepID=UPI001A975EF6|nr:cytochrome c [Longitalea luteola]
MNKLYIVCMSVIVLSCNIEQTVQPQTTEGISREADTTGWPASFGLGRPASAAAIAAMDIDVRPDGVGLPAGEGNAIMGKAVYMAKCVACHGTETTPGDAKLLGPVLISSHPGKKAKTIGNYWPYATTLFDYVRRAMPYNEPGTLTNEEVYQVTAFLLAANKVIDEQQLVNAQTLPNIRMPAQQRFVPDDRKGGPEIR